MDQSLLNNLATGGTTTFTGHAWFTVLLQPGRQHTVQLIGGKGAVNIDYLSVEPLD